LHRLEGTVPVNYINMPDAPSVSKSDKPRL
jgi:hypothetical protein